MNVVVLATRSTPVCAGVLQLFMKPCCVLLLLGLLLVERSEAVGSSAGSANTAGSSQLGPDSVADLETDNLFESVFSGENHWNRREEVWIEVRASSPNAPSPAAPEALNELTVAVRAKAPIWSITLRLPERQICPYDPKICFGYEFVEAPGSFHQCDIAAWPYERLDLPKSGLGVVDVKKKGYIDVCTVNNTFGDYDSNEKRRSKMSMLLRQDVPVAELTNKWLVFKIRVKNPPETPISSPDAKYLANTWQVVLRSKREVLGTRVLAAPKILPLWMCSYTDWMWTTPCTAKCGGGERYSIRRLLHPPPASYPSELLIGCDGALSQTHKCNEDACHVDCELGDWTPFADGPCSVTCGKGFEVQRRRVVEGPIGKGKLCPAYSELNVRVRYKECEATEPCVPRCDVEAKGEEQLFGGCSSWCVRNEGHREAFPVITRKEHGATNATCNAEHKSLPCGVKCRSINFFPGAVGRLPRIGKWAEMVLVFFLNNVAEGLELEAPEGFKIGKELQAREASDAAENLCLLKNHNIPRLKRCRVVERCKGPQNTLCREKAVFDLYNALEPMFKLGTGSAEESSIQPQYEVHFYVKSPSSCEAGFNSHGACKVTDGAWDWSLKTWNNEDDGYSSERERGGFEVYNDHAKEWRQAKYTEISPDQENEFLQGDIDIQEVNGDSQQGCPSSCMSPECTAGNPNNGGQALVGTKCTTYCSQMHPGNIRYCGNGDDYTNGASVDCNACE